MKEILKFAIIGIESEIDKREKSILRGRQLIKQTENVERIYEIQQIIREKKNEIEELSKKKFDYEWELAMTEEKSAQ